MKLALEKWGNNLVIHIPEALTDEVGLSAGHLIELNFTDSQSTLIEVEPVEEYTLDVLLAQITDDNIHSEIDFGIISDA